MTDLHDLYDAQWEINPSATADEVADAVLDSFRSMRTLRMAVRHLVVADVRNNYRADVRRRERIAFSPPRLRPAPILRGEDDGPDPLSERDLLLQDTVWCGPDFGYIQWGDVSYEHLDARIKALSALAAGINVTIAVCENVKSKLGEHGVKFVRDLPGDLSWLRDAA